MKRVTGIGGIFLKATNPAQLFAWYEEHLGIQRAPDSPPDNPSSMFEWRSKEKPEEEGMTV